MSKLAGVLNDYHMGIADDISATAGYGTRRIPLSINLHGTSHYTRRLNAPERVMKGVSAGIKLLPHAALLGGLGTAGYLAHKAIKSKQSILL